MEDAQKRAEKIQASLLSLSLDEKEEDSKKLRDKTLVGRILATRKCSRGVLATIVEGAWQTRRKVKIQTIAKNTFKFIFELKEDKLKIFERRPWSFNGSLLVLKEWEDDLAVHEGDFNTTAFFVQVHGLPLKWLNSSNAEKIGGQLGKVYRETVHKRSVVAGSYLRVRVELPIDIPLQAGFFLEKDNGVEVWIHFKYECLMDFCFQCGMVTHVTGRFCFKEPAKISSKLGITAKLYGPWLRASSKEFLQFLDYPAPAMADQVILENSDKTFQILGKNNTESSFEIMSAKEICKDNPNQTVAPLVDANEIICQSGETFEEMIALVSGEAAISDLHRSRLEHKLWKDDRLELLLNLTDSSPTLTALKLTLQGCSAEHVVGIQKALVNYAEEVCYDFTKLEIWAAKALQVLSALKAQKGEFTPRGSIRLPEGSKESPTPLYPKTQRKRMGHFECLPTEKRHALFSSEHTPTEKVLVIEKETNTEAREFQIGAYLGGVLSKRKSRSWKKEARRAHLIRDTTNDQNLGAISNFTNMVGNAEHPHHEQ